MSQKSSAPLAHVPADNWTSPQFDRTRGVTERA
jgi:hypothetical protein